MKNNKAFTLVELAIVIVIIGLLVGGVLQGQELIRQAQITRAVTDLQSYNTAFVMFKDKYKCLPGDCSNASTYFTGTNNGNGDNDIGSNSTESPLVWQHLALANLIKGTYSGVGANASPKPGVNSPISPVKGATYVIRNSPAFLSLPNYTKIDFGAVFTTTEYHAANSALKVDEAYNIDKKIDDGVANRGFLYSIDGSNAISGSCSAPWNTSGGANYNFSSPIIACRVSYTITVN